MSTETNKAIVRQWIDTAWNQGDLSQADALIDPTYVFHDPTAPASGPEGLKGVVTMYRAAYPDMHFTLEDLVAEGDKVVWRYTARGTHKGELMGIPPTGKQIEVTGIVISRFADDKWVEDWHNNDTLGMLQQLGVIPRNG
jgi:steroid delta-isomerase-like uncharacterized protein